MQKIASTTRGVMEKPDPVAQARRALEILQDPDRKGLILGLKDFEPLAQIATFDEEALIKLAEEKPLMMRSLINAYSN